MILFCVLTSAFILAAIGVSIWGIVEAWSDIRLWLKIILSILMGGEVFLAVMFFITLVRG